MAKPKALVKSGSKEEKAAHAPLTTKASNGTPYQLDPAQVEKAATALVSHMKRRAREKIDETGKQSLAADEDEADGGEDPIFLSVSTKHHVHDTSRLKPTKLPLPHPFYPNDVRICIFTKDPQRTYKDLVASDKFPEDLRTKVGRVIGLGKLKKKWKSFESKRQLLAEYDIFMVDDRILKSVTTFLGKTFYGTKAKRPVPIKLTAGARINKKKQDDKKEENVVGTAQGIAKEIQTALNATYVSMSASANTSIKVGKLSMTPQQLKENIEAIVTKLVNQHIEHKWRNVRALYIKGPTTKALPIWLSEELWVNEEQVLDQAPKPMVKDRAEKGEKKRKWDEWEEELLDPEEIAERRASRKPKKSKTKAPNKDVGSISKEKRSKLKRDALQSVQTPLIAG